MHFAHFVAGPANCSSMSVVPTCQASTSEDDSETDILIMLSSNGSLMCVVGYLIQFNGENRTVPVTSPSTNFTINVTQGHPLTNEVIVYTLDYENRTGQIPCTFNLPGEYACMMLHMYAPHRTKLVLV